MLLETIISLLMDISSIVITIVLNLLGGLVPVNSEWVVHLNNLVAKGLYFFPVDVFIAVISYFTFWYTIKMTWGILEFIVRKIPGLS